MVSLQLDTAQVKVHKAGCKASAPLRVLIIATVTMTAVTELIKRSCYEVSSKKTKMKMVKKK